MASFPSFAVKRKLSSEGGGYPHWVKGGQEIVYPTLDGTLMDVKIRTGTTIEASIPKPLFKGRGAPCGPGRSRNARCRTWARQRCMRSGSS